jgi:hypothetical protein
MTRSATLRSAIVALAALAVPAVADDAQPFEHWSAACRSDGYCSAKSGGESVLRIGRHAEGIYWEISLTTLEVTADSDAAFTATVDAGEPVQFTSPDEVAAYGSRRDIFFTGKNALSLMDRITPGANLAIDYSDTAGTAQRATFPLAGLNAALMWIDGEQNRIGAERVAEAPPVGRTLVDGLPALIPPALAAQHEADTDCAPLAGLPTAGEITVDTHVGDGMTLYILPCWTADRNRGWKAYVSPYDGTFTSLALPEYTPDDGWTATTHLLNIHYDAAEQTLIAGYNGSADGSCGARGTWRWQPYTFRLVEFRTKSECTGEATERFPVVWPEPAPAN